jgi:hypothetical protein
MSRIANALTARVRKPWPGRYKIGCPINDRGAMMKRLLSLFALVLAAQASAHHGWSEYDDQRPLRLTGTIEEFGYENPHGFVRLKTADKTWLVVLAPPSRMENRGLPRAQLAKGTTVAVEGYPKRSGAGELRAERITIGQKTTELR